MKNSIKMMLPILSALLLMPISGQLRQRFSDAPAGRDDGQLAFSPVLRNMDVENYKEYSYYYNGARWVQSWFQCDASREVAILSEGGRRRTFRYESFPKSQPSQKTVLSFQQKGDEDCGMMKCYFTLVAPGKSLEVFESNYKDDEAVWTSGHSLTDKHAKGRASAEQECRSFERTRLAVITDRRSIYVSESERGELEYRSFNYEHASEKPSVMLKGGVRSFDESKGIETFTFQSGDYAYVLNVSANQKQPFVEVLVKKNGALVQQEKCLSYNYLKKS